MNVILPSCNIMNDSVCNACFNLLNLSIFQSVFLLLRIILLSVKSWLMIIDITSILDGLNTLLAQLLSQIIVSK